LSNPVSFEMSSRFGPRHCGQSSARARAAAHKTTAAIAAKNLKKREFNREGFNAEHMDEMLLKTKSWDNRRDTTRSAPISMAIAICCTSRPHSPPGR
jgi:hypothetical protein